MPGTKDGLIRLSIEDRDPKRAAELANGWVEEFRKLSASLAITEAARRRLFFEQQLQQAKDKLTEAEDAMTKTEQTTGVLQIDSQARALIESAAILRAQVVAKQVQIEGMRSFAAEDNPNLILAKQELAALQSQLEHVAGSQTDTGIGHQSFQGKSDTSPGWNICAGIATSSTRRPFSSCWRRNSKSPNSTRRGRARSFKWWMLPCFRIRSPRRTGQLIVLAATFFLSLLVRFWVLLRERSARAFELPENRERLEAIKRRWKAKKIRDSVAHPGCGSIPVSEEEFRRPRTLRRDDASSSP